VKRLVEILGMASLYAAVGRLSLLLAIPPGYATAIWPPAGLALAGVLSRGRRVWPGIFFGSFAVNLFTSFDGSSAGAMLRSIALPCAIGAGASLQAIAGAYLVRRFTSADVFGSERDVLKLLVLGGPLSCLLNASISSISLALAGAIGTGELTFSWWTWWVGDTIGVLVFAPLVLVWASQVSPIVKRRRIWVSVPLFCTFVVVVLLFLRATESERKRVDLQFQNRVDRLAQALTRKLDSSLEVLESFGNVFGIAMEGGRSDVRKFTRRLLARHPELQMLCWNRYVRGAERAEYELSMTGTDEPRFELKELDPRGALVRAGDREDHIAIHFLEPDAGNEQVLGFDAASDPQREATLRRACDSGELSATGRIDPVLESQGASGVLFVLPVYSGDAVPDSVEERRRRLQGFATGILRTDLLLNAVMEDAELRGFALRLWDLSAGSTPQPLDQQLLINSAQSDLYLAAEWKPSASRIAKLGIAGRRWMLELLPSATYLAAHRSWQAWGFLAGGLLFTGVLGAFLLVVTSRTVRVEEIVAQRTIELRHANETLKREVAERIEAQKIASIDPLTELLNRRGFEAELSKEVHGARRTGSSLAAILLDLDDFKRINETLGHAVGDVVLKEVAARLTETLRPTDHLARIGGDEFLALLPDTRLAEAARVAERLRLSVADSPLRLNSGPVRLTSSLGLGRVPTSVVSVEEILAMCQQSLQRSKKAGKNRVSVRGARNDLGGPWLQGVVEVLLRPSSFRVVRHAILSLSDETVAGWEFLSRGPAGSFEMPGDFFRLALERNILTLVDLQCLRTCIEAARDLPEDTRCHVNLFPSTLLDTPEERLVELFPRAPGSPRYCVEVSEQQFIGDPACLRGPVGALKDAGIQVAIDDVGFGRSSLESLILLEPDLVKIDQKIVRGAARDPGKERSLQRLVDVVNAMKCEVVAEGIESRNDLELLRALGVPHGQGFLWGQPT
jgi:diguanylate cyclase (GGDEF)-like protein